MLQSQLLSKAEIKKISEKYPEGISSGEIVKIFQSRGIKFSEATFRKYVQMGLVERCKRVGQKGKHRGSHGVYPIATVERINAIKRMISGDVTLEQLRGSYFSIRQRLEEVDRVLGEVGRELSLHTEAKGRKERIDLQMQRELGAIGKNVTRLVETLQRLENETFAM
mgnify:CR=1 FL=1